MSRFRPALLASLGLTLLAGPAFAESPRASGLAGARASALGGAVSADSDDCSATYYNPANLALGERSWLCLDYSANFAELEPAGRSEAKSSLHTVGGGLVARGKLFALPFGFGATLALPSAKLSRIESIAAEEASWVLDTNRPRVSFGAIGFGIAPIPALSFGVALHVLAGVRGTFGVGGSLAQPNAYDSKLRHSVDADLASARSFAAGVSLRPSNDWQLGLAYQHRARVRQSIDGTLAGTVGAPPLVIPAQYQVETVVTPAAYPSLLALSGRFELGELGLFGELAWEDYSEWPSPDEASTTSLTLGDVPVELGTGAAPARRAAPSPHDRWLPRLGAEYSLPLDARATLKLRGGYAFERSPLPAQRTTRWLDADRHTLTAGAGFEIVSGPSAWRIDAYGLVTLLPERTAVGASELGPALRASGVRAGFGLGTSYGF